MSERAITVRRAGWSIAQPVLLAVMRATAEQGTPLHNVQEFVAHMTGVDDEAVWEGVYRGHTSRYFKQGDGPLSVDPTSEAAATLGSATSFETRSGEPLSRDALMIALGQQLAAETMQRMVQPGR